MKNIIIMPLLLLTSGSLFAAEGLTPMMPGGTTGIPMGAMPPDGLYFSMDMTIENGTLKKGNGKDAKVAGGKVKFNNNSIIPALTWVPGWQLLGARYSATIMQPFKFLNKKNTGNDMRGENHLYGFLNTVITPINLSWDLNNGMFIGAGLTVYPPNGKTDYTRNAQTGKKEASWDNLAWDYWTFEPNIAITYLNSGWGITMNNIFDFNRENNTSDYRSGNTYYLDMTVTKEVTPKLTLGLIGNWTKQISDDKISGKRVAAIPGISSEGHKVEHLLFGPMISYQFNSVTLKGRFLYNFHAENDPNMSFFHLTVSAPLSSIF